MTAYYNEIDPYAAQWLRNLIDAGHIAPGIVDERSIEDVFPSDLRGFTQCHFFAGIGVWSYALRLAGWSDDRPVWTGSCPCQPFSQAGQGAGLDDERHLWPHWHHLIKECSPGVIVGEQVASKDAEPWLDLVHDDMEALAYAFGAVAFPSAGVGAPHIRDRTYWMANAAGTRPQGRELGGQRTDPQRPAIERGSAAGRLADYNQHRCVEATGDRGGNSEHHAEPRCELGGLADRPSSRRREECADARRSVIGDCAQGLAAGSEHGGGALRTGPTNSVWRNADWLLCRDGKWRPVEPGTFPLAHGAPARVGRLRAYGNAINAQAARTFIEAVMEASNA